MTALPLFFVCAAMGADPALEPLPSAPEVRRAVERSLPFLMKGGFAWKQKRCISCHQIPFAVWTHFEAQARGLTVDAKQLRELTDWMLDFSADKKYPDEMVDGYLDTVVLASELAPRSAKMVRTFEMFEQLLARQQLIDGSWMTQDGISRNEPGFQVVWLGRKASVEARREATEVDTMWTLLGMNALQRFGTALSEPTRASLIHNRARALTWLQDSLGGRRSDWLAFRMLLERDLGHLDRVVELRQALVHQQNADGGWGLSKGDASHALVTGQVLYALSSAGIPEGAAVARAWKYLLATQQKDGSWEAPSRVMAEHCNSITIHWGTGWATLGLLRTLPKEP